MSSDKRFYNIGSIVVLTLKVWRQLNISLLSLHVPVAHVAAQPSNSNIKTLEYVITVGSARCFTFHVKISGLPTVAFLPRRIWRRASGATTRNLCRQHAQIRPCECEIHKEPSVRGATCNLSSALINTFIYRRSRHATDGQSKRCRKTPKSFTNIQEIRRSCKRCHVVENCAQQSFTGSGWTSEAF